MSKTKYYSIRKPSEEHQTPKSGRMFGCFLPLKDMEVGDSFIANIIDKPRVQSMIHSYGKKNGATFMMCMEIDKLTVWRTA